MADDALISFLKSRGIAGAEALAVLATNNVASLPELAVAIGLLPVVTKIDGDLAKKELFVAQTAFRGLEVDAVENAVHDSDSGHKSNSDALAAFLLSVDVLRTSKGREKLLHILRTSTTTSVDSLGSLRTLKERGEDDARLSELTKKIAAWSPDAGIAFASVTPAQVAQAIRGKAVASSELTEFLAKKRFPAGSEEVFAASGVTTLEQLKSVAEDGGQRAALTKKLKDSGLQGADGQLEELEVGAIDREIAIAKDPVVRFERKKIQELDDAIKEVTDLREKVEKATGESFEAVQEAVKESYKRVLKKVKGVCDADFTEAKTAAGTTKTELKTLLDATIGNIKDAKNVLSTAEQKEQYLPEIVRTRGMLSGFLMTAGAIAHKGNHDLVKAPKDLNELKRSPGAYESKSLDYVGSSTRSVAVATAQEASLTIASSTEASGAWFTGSGVAAFSAAARYADSHRSSKDSEHFESETTYECGRINFVSYPKQAIQFREDDLPLSEEARERLKSIARAPIADRDAAVLAFYEEYGSHFFRWQVLGGRYELNAKGTAKSGASKGKVVQAVADTAAWAASASGSYATLGGAAGTGAAVQGEKGSASARADRYDLAWDHSAVTVTTRVLGGAGMAPRDIWAQTLAYNGTWKVIDRDQPMGVWELLRKDSTLDQETRGLATTFERVWVRTVFGASAKKASPLIHRLLDADSTITTCKGLKDLVDALPEKLAALGLDVMIVKETSALAEHPEATAVSHADHMKLIGGGAVVDYAGHGNLLTGSYPEGRGWRASAKSHSLENKATVTAYAIYLYDPYDLWEVKKVDSKAQTPALTPSNRPAATATLPAEYVLTGGGARLEWHGQGLLLTESRPESSEAGYKSWVVKGKDHKHEDAGTATAWAFGIKPRVDFIKTPTFLVEQGESTGGHRLDAAKTPAPDRVIVGGGASVSYQGYGGLLVASGPASDLKSWTGAAKDHQDEDSSLRLKVWVISAKGRLLPPQ